MRQTIKGFDALGLLFGAGLEFFNFFQIMRQPWGFDGAGGQAGHADKLDHVFFASASKDFLEGRAGISFGGHGKGRAQLRGSRTQ